ncbi:hypothetical protein AAVH_22847 [Aphelenchoides avenae]|nr:hypothetical protein AAVH_37186 [Aphelenchus avenae]KAH7709882.1 hypothetical protein AAVH_22847 [Aphelenchus avenae]
MQADHFYESFFFCSRKDLEGLQLVRKSVRKRILRHSQVLPLRPVWRVDMAHYCYEEIRIFVEQPTCSFDADPDYEHSINDGNFEEAFRRLQNTCINEFFVGIRDSAFLRYWISREDASFTVVSIVFDVADVEDNGTAILDSIINRLRPRTMDTDVEESSWSKYDSNSAYTALLARESFVNSLHTCRLLGAEPGAYSPPDFFLNGPGYANYELCCNYLDTPNLIDGFIESFVRDDYPNKKLESVWLKWGEWNEPARTPKKLSNPTKVDVPLPENDFTRRCARFFNRRVCHQCEMHSFVNLKQWKRMDVHKWRVDYELVDRRRVTDYFFLVRVNRVKNL